MELSLLQCHKTPYNCSAHTAVLDNWQTLQKTDSRNSIKKHGCGIFILHLPFSGHLSKYLEWLFEFKWKWRNNQMDSVEGPMGRKQYCSRKHGPHLGTHSLLCHNGGILSFYLEFRKRRILIITFGYFRVYLEISHKIPTFFQFNTIKKNVWIFCKSCANPVRKHL